MAVGQDLMLPVFDRSFSRYQTPDKVNGRFHWRRAATAAVFPNSCF